MNKMTFSSTRASKDIDLPYEVVKKNYDADQGVIHVTPSGEYCKTIEKAGKWAKNTFSSLVFVPPNTKAVVIKSPMSENASYEVQTLSSDDTISVYQSFQNVALPNTNSLQQIPLFQAFNCVVDLEDNAHDPAIFVPGQDASQQHAGSILATARALKQIPSHARDQISSLCHSLTMQYGNPQQMFSSATWDQRHAEFMKKFSKK